MLQSKGTTIVSEVKDFFTSSEKAINTVFNILSSLTLSEKQLGFVSKPNTTIKNNNKLFLLLLFPFFEIKDVWHYQGSSLYPIFKHGKDLFYRFLNQSTINWIKVSYRLTLQLINKTKIGSHTENQDLPKCLIIDNTDLPKTGMNIELIGKVFSHVLRKSRLGFKGLFMGYHDGKSFFFVRFFVTRRKRKEQEETIWFE